jgi:hypothetical protein
MMPQWTFIVLDGDSPFVADQLRLNLTADQIVIMIKRLEHEQQSQAAVVSVTLPGVLTQVLED